MPIQPLPEEDTRILTSSFALNDAKSVVKELVDNALDARASAISIEISANTLDIIQVKDNGSGVGVEDRQLLCRRGCTSKIRSLDDLDRLGGTFLGFRGEALASMAELSQVVIVTTRVDGEVAGTSLKFGASGMLSSSSQSHPVGTTVRIQNFLTNIPVRKQTALKSAAKTLQAIKAILFEFAFARGDVRFSLKVLKGKNDRMNWTYAASSGDSLIEVAAKIVGKDIASQCTALSMTSADLDVDIEDGWEIDALLVSPKADFDKVRGSNQYISIDRRPVSPDRRTIKEVTKLNKRYLQKTSQTAQDSGVSPITRPFLVLQIRCPPKSYDLNIEPAKDEVIFFRPDILLSLAETLLRKAYGDVDNETTTLPTRPGNQPEAVPQAPKDLPAAVPDDLEIPETPTQGEDDVEWGQAEDSATRDRSFINPFTIAAMNAIVGPKRMDATRRSALTSPGRIVRPGHHTDVPLHESRPVGNSHRTPLGPVTPLPSPTAPEPSPTRHYNSGPTLAQRATASGHEETQHEEADDDVEILQARATGLQAWLTPDSAVRASHRDAVVKPVGPGESLGRSPLGHSARATAPLSQHRTTPPGGNPNSGLRWGPGQKPFKLPSKSSDHSHPFQGNLPEHRFNVKPPVRQPNNNMTHIISGPGEEDTPDVESHGQRSSGSEVSRGISSASNTELSDIMEFEYRKKAAVAYQRKLRTSFRASSGEEIAGRPQRPHTLSPSSNEANDVDAMENEDYAAMFTGSRPPLQKPARSNPHRNRYLAAIKGLSRSDVDESPDRCEGPDLLSESVISEAEPNRAGLAQDDPRAYFMRQRRKSGDSKLYRTKSSRFPLESIPADAMTLHLVLTTKISEDVTAMKKEVQTLALTDSYVTRGEIEQTDLFETSLSSEWESVLREIVEKKYRCDAEDGRALVPHLKITATKCVESLQASL